MLHYREKVTTEGLMIPLWGVASSKGSAIGIGFTKNEASKNLDYITDWGHLGTLERYPGVMDSDIVTWTFKVIDTVVGYFTVWVVEHKSTGIQMLGRTREVATDMLLRRMTDELPKPAYSKRGNEWGTEALMERVAASNKEKAVEQKYAKQQYFLGDEVTYNLRSSQRPEGVIISAFYACGSGEPADPRSLFYTIECVDKTKLAVAACDILSRRDANHNTARPHQKTVCGGLR